MYLSLAHESGVIKKKKKRKKNAIGKPFLVLSAQEVPGKLLHGLLCGAGSQVSGSLAQDY